MNTPRYQLDFIQAGVEQLKDYLFSDLIYWPIGIRAVSGHTAYPQLTLGTLILFLHQAEPLSIDSKSKTELSGYKNDIELIRTSWQAHWRRKSQAEFIARIKLWRDFLQEYRKDPEGNFDRYEYEVTRRVMLEWLGQESPSLKRPELEMLESLDLLLKSLFVHGAFIWGQNLKSEFPEEVFWYLYGKLPVTWPGSA
ncbi:MAG: hypothetical protein A2Z16_14775 [Chloroflexi bacterium RBG_16_54_18]|nr:MAG: hypothetical protein A2Z16_14775 [Chloroflexi bacterium RBG_16_54_18]